MYTCIREKYKNWSRIGKDKKKSQKRLIHINHKTLVTKKFSLTLTKRHISQKRLIHISFQKSFYVNPPLQLTRILIEKLNKVRDISNKHQSRSRNIY